ncbi:MAG: hypothetical protein KAG43_09295 [Candidatus Marithrix sp.]|nr:hypothetical protein [Candidatus Marithrix sp.]
MFKKFLFLILFLLTPSVFAMDDLSQFLLNSNITNFAYGEWLTYYQEHFWFSIHIFLLILVLITFLYSFFISGSWQKLRLYKRPQPFVIELAINKITKRYHFFAEIFLLVGLAGAALSVQSAITPDFFTMVTNYELGTKNQEHMASAIKSGLAFSAAGILLAVFCYILRGIELILYRGIWLREKQREQSDLNNSIHDISNLYLLLESFLNKDGENIITLSMVLDELKNSNQNSLEKLLSHSEQNIKGVLEVIKSSQITFQEQLQKTSELQHEFIAGGDSIANRMEQLNSDIKDIHQPFLNSLVSISNDLKESQEVFKQDLVEQVKALVHTHELYLDQNTENAKLVLDRNLEKTAAILIRSWEQEVEQIYKRLRVEFIQVSELKLNIDEQVQQVITDLHAGVTKINDQVCETEKLKNIIVCDFLKDIGENSKDLAQAFDEYTEKTTRVTEINKINVKLIQDVMDQSGLIIKKSLFKKMLAKINRK